MTFAQLARKYGAVIIFPTFTAGAIFADWSHTRAWKQQLRQQAKDRELL